MTVYNHKNGKEIKEYFGCECGSDEHLMVFRYWAEDGDDDKELYLNVHLANYENFFQRLWVAVRFLFGYRSKFGEFDEVVIRKDDINRLFNLINTVKKDMEGKIIEKY